MVAIIALFVHHNIYNMHKAYIVQKKPYLKNARYYILTSRKIIPSSEFKQKTGTTEDNFYACHPLTPR